MSPTNRPNLVPPSEPPDTEEEFLPVSFERVTILILGTLLGLVVAPWYIKYCLWIINLK
jgi:hypothetical protein